MPLRIVQPTQPLRRHGGEAKQHALARRGGKFVFRRLAVQVRAIGVGDDQSGVAGKQVARHFLREGKEQPITMQPVVRPLPVGAQIGQRRLDLDDPDLAALVQRHQIGTPAGRQRHLV
jgi:NAD-dependent oxidoreductase involved in siderophore biosynthesis